MKQISYGKERQTKNGACEVEVMTRAMLVAPTHRWKELKCFKDAGEYDHQQASCAE